jgi:hypothetical protein
LLYNISFSFERYYFEIICYIFLLLLLNEAGLFTASGPGCTGANAYYPQTSVQEIATGGVPLSKIVIGKYLFELSLVFNSLPTLSFFFFFFFLLPFLTFPQTCKQCLGRS